MLEIEAAARNQEAKARLTQIREQLGMSPAQPEITQGETPKD